MGLDGLIAYGSGNHGFLSMNAAWFLSAFKQVGPHMAVILPVDDEPILIATLEQERARLRERSTIREVICVAPGDFVATVRAEMDRRGLASRKFGLAADGQSHSISQAWPTVFDTEPVDCRSVVNDIARIRDEWSLRCVREGTAIAERGYEFLLENAEVGMWEHEVAGELEAYIRHLGSDDNFQFLCAGHHNVSIHRPMDRILQDGDVILAEITPSVDGEFLQICRTAVFGGPTDVQKEKFAVLEAGLRAGMGVAKPGTPVADVVEAINAPIAAAGYQKYTVPPYMRTRGHGMSLGSPEPMLSLDSAHVLEKGMVFIMHPNQYIPETGYLLCGEPVVITDHGAALLTSRMGTLDTIH